MFHLFHEEAAVRKIRAAMPHRERLIEERRADPRLAADYLKAATDDKDPRALLAALRTVVGVRGMATAAEAAKIPANASIEFCRFGAVRD